MDDYRRVRPQLFPSHDAAIAGMAAWAERQRRGEAVVWCTLEGFFWFPRTLMGFDKLMLAFYDQPELLHAINRDLLAFNLSLLDKILQVCVPTFMTLAEDMSYNHGPMISKDTFELFVAPYYRQLVPRLLERGIMPFVDTDGDVTLLVPWLAELGVDGVLPLERQAGVDGMRLRERYPRLRMVGHFDKMTMNQGEAGDARGVRAAPAADEEGRVHPQRGPPDAAGRVAGTVSRLSPSVGGIHGRRAPVRPEGMQGCVGMLLQMRTRSFPSPRPSPLGRGRSAGHSKRGLSSSLSLRERVRVRGNRPYFHRRLPVAFQLSARIYFI